PIGTRLAMHLRDICLRCVDRITCSVKESSMKSPITVLLGALAFFGTSLVPYASAEPVPPYIGVKVPDFVLPDTHGVKISLRNFSDRKAVVVIFLGTECVITNAYMPRLVEMQKEYAPRGVQILGINSNLQDSAQQVAEHAKQNALNFPMLKDEGNVVAD